jgi:hypothetical protein
MHLIHSVARETKDQWGRRTTEAVVISWVRIVEMPKSGLISDHGRAFSRDDRTGDWVENGVWVSPVPRWKPPSREVRYSLDGRPIVYDDLLAHLDANVAPHSIRLSPNGLWCSCGSFHDLSIEIDMESLDSIIESANAHLSRCGLPTWKSMPC